MGNSNSTKEVEKVKVININEISNVINDDILLKYIKKTKDVYGYTIYQQYLKIAIFGPIPSIKNMYNEKFYDTEEKKDEAVLDILKKTINGVGETMYNTYLDMVNQ